MGLVTLTFHLLNFLILKQKCDSHHGGEPSFEIWAHWPLELFAMYAMDGRNGQTDGQTDGRTKATHIAPFPTGGGINSGMAQWMQRGVNRKHISGCVLARVTLNIH